jgi:hypothetical protein
MPQTKPKFGYFPVLKSHFASHFATLKEGGERQEKRFSFLTFFIKVPQTIMAGQFGASK